MRISQLAAETGVPVATVKYYLREGLLPAGVPTATTQAQYDAGHVHRLRLVRALSEVAGLRLEAIRAVLEAVDDPDLDWHEAIGAAHTRLSPGSAAPSPPALDRVEALVRRRGWQVGTAPDGGGHRAALGRALDALAALDMSPDDELLDLYADAADRLAAHEVAAVDEDDRAVAAERVVVGTLLLEPVLLALRRMAQEAASYRRHR